MQRPESGIDLAVPAKGRSFLLGRSFNMRKSATVLIGALFVVVLAAPAVAQTQTVTGQLIDMACYAQDKENTGNHHKNRGLICAQACAREGFAVGLLTTNGKVYQVIGDLAVKRDAKLVPHMAQTVTLTGDVREEDGHMIIVASNLTTIKK
jgi:hypothetical protein